MLRRNREIPLPKVKVIVAPEERIYPSHLTERCKVTGRCGACQRLQSRTFCEDIEHHDSADLKQSAEGGCDLCQFLWKVMGKLEDGGLPSKITINYKTHRLYYKYYAYPTRAKPFELFVPQGMHAVEE
jgi:CRISPR/Cas system-associated protein Cas10 (large subunit of type III CRISPR-Cas system)